MARKESETRYRCGCRPGAPEMIGRISVVAARLAAFVQGLYTVHEQLPPSTLSEARA